MADDVELTLVTMDFRASDPVRLMPVLSKYVVLSRGHDGCRNIDLCASSTTPNRFVVIEKWDSPESQQAHFDSAEMVEMAQSCRGLLTRAPDIDLLEGISAHAPAGAPRRARWRPPSRRRRPAGRPTTGRRRSRAARTRRRRRR